MKLLSPPSESGEKNEEELVEKISLVRNEISPETSPESPQTNPEDEVVSKIADAVIQKLGGAPPEVQKLPGVAAPVEDIELVGEKIDYEVALNPEIS